MFKPTILALASATALLYSMPASAGTLENLERERAVAVDAMLDPALTAAERHTRLDSAQRRLIDLERMVLRDDSLKGRNTPPVSRAFANYDLTFLAHASLEHKTALVDTWLEQIGVSTQSLMGSRKGQKGAR